MGPSDEDLRGFVENLPVGVFRSTPAGKFERVNSALAAMLGYESTAALLALESTAELYADPSERERMRAAFDPYGKLPGVRVVFKRKDGTLLPVRCHARSVFDSSGAPIA